MLKSAQAVLYKYWSQEDQRWDPILWGLFLALIGLVIYLPDAQKMGFYNDDWYLMYDAKVMGIQFFKTIFEIDRPLRAPLQSLYYSLYGENIELYQYSALLIRVLGAVFFGLALRLVVKNNKSLWVLASLLFFIYPGFLSQPNAIDYQAHLVSVMLAMASLWLFMMAVTATQQWRAAFFGVLSMVLTLLYLGLMEYFLGIEIFKAALGIYGLKLTSVRSLLDKLREKWMIFLAWAFGGAGFLFWRVVLFDSQRKATDISLKLDLFSGDLVGNIVQWSTGTFINFFHAMFGAWIVPFYQASLKISTRDLIVDLIWFFLLALVIWTIFDRNEQENGRFDGPLLLAGVIGTIAAIFPVIFAGRGIDFGDYSRYTLPAMASVVVTLSVLILNIRDARWRALAVVLLLFSAVLVHRSNFRTFAERTRSERTFWWQVAWRIPQMPLDTSLVISYPHGNIQEDYFIWGPANFIYSDQTNEGEELTIPINGLVLDQENMNLILTGKGQIDHYRRGNSTSADLSDVLVISQASERSCVRVIDRTMLEYSEYEDNAVRVVGAMSNPELIPAGDDTWHVPTNIFGEEPERGWCYYFEKAEIARQSEDWQSVIRLGEEALEKGYYPSDRSEWMPFVQANILLGNASEVKKLGKRFIESKLLRSMACENFLPLATDTATRDQVEETFCQ